MPTIKDTAKQWKRNVCNEEEPEGRRTGNAMKRKENRTRTPRKVECLVSTSEYTMNGIQDVYESNRPSHS